MSTWIISTYFGLPLLNTNNHLRYIAVDWSTVNIFVPWIELAILKHHWYCLTCTSHCICRAQNNISLYSITKYIIFYLFHQWLKEFCRFCFVAGVNLPTLCKWNGHFAIPFYVTTNMSTWIISTYFGLPLLNTNSHLRYIAVDWSTVNIFVPWIELAILKHHGYGLTCTSHCTCRAQNNICV